MAVPWRKPADYLQWMEGSRKAIQSSMCTLGVLTVIIMLPDAEGASV